MKKISLLVLFFSVLWLSLLLASVIAPNSAIAAGYDCKKIELDLKPYILAAGEPVSNDMEMPLNANATTTIRGENLYLTDSTTESKVIGTYPRSQTSVEIENIIPGVTKLYYTINWNGMVQAGTDYLNSSDAMDTGTHVVKLGVSTVNCGSSASPWAKTERYGIQLKPANELYPALVNYPALSVSATDLFLTAANNAFDVSIGPTDTATVAIANSNNTMRVYLGKEASIEHSTMIKAPASCTNFAAINTGTGITSIDGGTGIQSTRIFYPLLDRPPVVGDTLNIKIPFDTAVGDTQPCKGVYTVTGTAVYRFDVDALNTTVPRKFSTTVNKTLTINVLTAADLVTFRATFINKVTGAEIDLSGGSPTGGAPKYYGADISLTPTPVPMFDKTIFAENGSARSIIPDFYGLNITPPNGFTGEYCPNPTYPGAPLAMCTGGPNNVLSVSSFNLSSSREARFELCPIGDATCTPSANIGEEEPPDDTEPPEAEQLCVPEEIIQGGAGWLVRDALQMLCGITQFNIELALPMLDVNIPIVTISGDTITYDQRQMFSQEITPEDIQSKISSYGGLAASLIPVQFSPPAVYDVWSKAYDVARGLIILTMIFYAYMIMFRADPNKYALKQFLVVILTALLLSSASYTICAVLFDVFRILAFIAKDILVNEYNSLGVQGVTFSEWIMTLARKLATPVAAIGVPVLIANRQLLMLPCVGCLTSYALAIGSLILLLYARMLFLYALVIMSPIVFVLGIIPEWKSLSKTWWSSFIKLLSVFPITVLLYYLFLIMGNVFG